ncbi:LytR/AlgR family response regulator transcription factor [Alloscardovia criceti]|uniref:LytR/AlgR family response regulator transcription factor n=1 Tax=Alloscardovia criceti TaxID=356828 RepID=UPI00146160ED|nr:LytTR family DNA-binding domain-containing protein [Alloscardovia criceti]
MALVEDTPEDAAITRAAIERYVQHNPEVDPIRIDEFSNAQDFLDAAVSHNFDLVFLDIDMPGEDGQGINGMTAAAQYRAQALSHETIPLIFTTKVAQLAVQGYEVSAVGYLIKPFDYASFALAMRRAMEQMKLNAVNVTITVVSAEGTRFISSRDVTHIEVRDHMVYIHLRDGSVQTMWGTLKELVDKLQQAQFIQCNRYAIVNLNYVTGFSDKELTIQGSEDQMVSISRGRKQDVMRALLAFKAIR